MNLRGTNFVSQIFHISVIKSTIEGLFGGDKFYFTVNVDNIAKVFCIDVEEHEDGEVFKLVADNTKYTKPNMYDPRYPNTEDKVIKVISSRNSATGYDPVITSYSQEPAKDMAGYVMVYIDAMQTV